MRIFPKTRSGQTGLVLILSICAVGIFAPWIAPYGPWELSGPPTLPPFRDTAHWLGTDTLGRDILSGIIYGTRVSLLVGFLCTVATVIAGVLLGATSGYFGGWIDDALMRFTEFFQVLPSFIFAVVLVAVFQPSLYSVMTAIILVSWPPVARLVRSEFLTLKRRDFVDAAVTAGKGNGWIIFREIMPNATAPIAAMATLMVAASISLESSLSFLGLGDPNYISWGYMIGVSRTLIRTAWWMSVFPGIALVIAILAINMVGDSLGQRGKSRVS
ncbi:ABC transporter permease [Ochrobactrum sp. EDr1-4]|uniref:ABC transporter permease n=1 Tax=Ochrobactrum sp. EDr1-4 TaxID=3368622 RepID=UPI003BA0FCF2